MWFWWGRLDRDQELYPLPTSPCMQGEESSELVRWVGLWALIAGKWVTCGLDCGRFGVIQGRGRVWLCHLNCNRRSRVCPAWRVGWCPKA